MCPKLLVNYVVQHLLDSEFTYTADAKHCLSVEVVLTNTRSTRRDSTSSANTETSLARSKPTRERAEDMLSKL